MIILKLSPEKRKTATWWIFYAAQLSMAVSGILSHFGDERFSFLVGMLAGFSMVGNLFFLTQVKHLGLKVGGK